MSETAEPITDEALARETVGMLASAGLALGIITAIFGLVLLVWPKSTVLVVSIFFGVYLLVSGVAQIAQAIAGDLSAGGRALLGIGGTLSILLGLLAFRSFTHSVTILAIFIGFGWVIRGISLLVSAIADKETPGRGWFIFLGALSAIAGIVILSEPAPSLVVIAVTSGVLLLILGLVEIFASIKIRGLAKA